MKPIPLFSAVLLLALSCRTAWPQTTESRAQVAAETRDAIHNGDIPVNDEGLTANEVNPSRYPKKAVVRGLTRAEVKEETVAAREAGDIPFGEIGLTPREVNPTRYPPQAKETGLTRSEVKRETEAAIRAGDVQVGDDGRTLAEKDPQRYAGAPAKVPNEHFWHRVGATEKAGSASAN